MSAAIGIRLRKLVPSEVPDHENLVSDFYLWTAWGLFDNVYQRKRGDTLIKEVISLLTSNVRHIAHFGVRVTHATCVLIRNVGNASPYSRSHGQRDRCRSNYEDVVNRLEFDPIGQTTKMAVYASCCLKPYIQACQTVLFRQKNSNRADEA